MERFQGGRRRRAVLGGVATLATASLAGCPGDGASVETEPPETPTAAGGPEPEQQLPRPVAGDPEADVTVAVYEDLACPHCRTYTLETQPDVWSDYVEPGEIRYEWHDLPIPVDDPQSWLAADAARSVQANAASIDAFWSFTEAVYERQDELSLDLYETLAAEVDVDGATVREEAEDRTYEPTVAADRQAGRERGVTGTPTVFVEDSMIEGPTLESLRNAIDDALGE